MLAEKTEVELIPRGKLKKLAVQRQIDLNRSRGEYDPNVVLKASPKVKERWTVNCIRHWLTFYEGVIPFFNGKPEHIDAHIAYQNALIGKIAEAYPFLKAECERQKKEYIDEDRELARTTLWVIFQSCQPLL